MATEVDPLDAIIALARTSADLTGVVGDRISNRHRYGQDESGFSYDWPQDETGLVFLPASGEANLYDEVQQPTLEARCYGRTFGDAGEVYKVLIDWTRSVDRQTVALTGGLAFIYHVRKRTEQLSGLDETATAEAGGMPYYSVTLTAAVHECFLL